MKILKFLLSLLKIFEFDSLEKEANDFIKLHIKSVIYGSLETFKELYDMPQLYKFKETNIHSNIKEVIAYLETNKKMYMEVYQECWKLAEPLIKDNMSYTVEEN